MKKFFTPSRLLGQTWKLVFFLEMLIFAAVGLVLVWSNTEHSTMRFALNSQQSELREKQSLKAKLEVEREQLLSPYELRLRADRFGMHEPRPGQIRRIDGDR